MVPGFANLAATGFANSTAAPGFANCRAVGYRVLQFSLFFQPDVRCVSIALYVRVFFVVVLRPSSFSMSLSSAVSAASSKSLVACPN